jgi:hypothetical protein
MPSNMKRWNGTNWIEVADFDPDGSAKWVRPLTTPVLADLHVPGLSMSQDLKDIHYRPDVDGPLEKIGNWSDWESAWGVIKRGTFPSNPTGAVTPTNIAASQTVTNLATMQFQPVEGRRYRFVAQVRAVGSNPSVAFFNGVFNLTKNGGSLGAGNDPWKIGAHTWTTWKIAWTKSYVPLGTDLATWNLHYSNGGNALQMWFNTPSAFYVEDLGPNRGDTL